MTLVDQRTGNFQNETEPFLLKMSGAILGVGCFLYRWAGVLFFMILRMALKDFSFDSQWFRFEFELVNYHSVYTYASHLAAMLSLTEDARTIDLRIYSSAIRVLVQRRAHSIAGKF